MIERPPPSDPGTDSAIRLLRRLDELKTDGPLRAHPGERFFARLIDLCVVGGAGLAVDVAVLFVSAVILGFEQRNDNLSPTQAGAITTGIGFGAVLLVGAAYEIGLTWRWGQTVGKRRRGLHVVRDDGRPVALGRSSVRFAAWAVPWGLCFGGWQLTFPERPLISLLFFAGSFASLGLMAWAFRDPDGRGIHDRIAGTRVIMDR